VFSDGTRERELQLVGRMVVGRDPSCEISHEDSLLSRRHAEFVTVGETVTVRDLGSRNGVFVNGSRAAEHVLTPGDIVQIGPLRARFVIDHTAGTITPEHLDADRTAMIRNAFAIQPEVDEAVSSAPDDDDDEVTRLIPAPRMPAPARPAAAPPPAVTFDDDDAPTNFISGSQMREMADAPPAWDSVTTGSPAAAGRSVATEPVRRAEPHSSAYVFGLLLILAAVILSAASLPVLIWRREALEGNGAPMSFIWFGLPITVALVATYLVGVSINRHITGALAAARSRS